MTDFDKQLIEKARGIRRWDYRQIDVLVAIADTDEARKRLKWKSQFRMTPVGGKKLTPSSK